MPTTLAKCLYEDRISQLPLAELYSVEPSASVQQVIEGMGQRRSGCALVVHDGKAVGIFTERDFLCRVLAKYGDVGQPVEAVMTPSPTTITPADTVATAVERLQTGGYRHLPVVSPEGVPISVLSIKDVVHYLVEYFPANVYNLPPKPGVVHPREGA